MKPILIENVLILDPANNREEYGRLLILDGVFAPPETAPPGALTLDGRGLVAAPGLVDMHVHLRDPGQTHKEDVFTACEAAAAGGVTCLAAMPNTSPAADSPEVIRLILEKAKEAKARVYPVAAITKGLKSEFLTDFAALKEAGAVAVSDDGRPVEQAAMMLDAMKVAAALGLPVLSHAEDLSLAAGGIMHEGSVSARLGVKGIPAAAEDVGTARDLALCASAGVPVHICHVSTRTAVAMIRDAKRRGAPVTCETAPHYFTLGHEMLMARSADFRMNPPLREEEDRLAVLEGLRDGTIDAIATDHAPHSPEEKADFEKAPNGILGLQTLLALSITELVRPGHIGLAQAVRLLSLNPARILGIPGGTLSAGAPGDLVLFDPDEEWTLTPEMIKSKSRNSPFIGRRMFGRVRLTVTGGCVTYRDGI